tara:strand:+ start:1206 stop:1616 length:411 start_codon:yes stop_codon:yes gene_type:complete
MINSSIVRIASFTKNAGLKNNFTHRSSIKNSLCGDFIKTEFIVQNSKVKSMRYETESCILCEASASLLSRKIKNANIENLEREIKKIKNFKKNSNYNFPLRFKEFNKLINKKNINRLNCVILPMEAFLKAFRIKKC